MKQAHIYFLLAGAILCVAGCKRTQNGNPQEALPDTPVQISHKWINMDREVCRSLGIELEDIRAWKRYFEDQFVYDDWDAVHMEYFVNTDRYLAIMDLQALAFDEENDSIPKFRCTLWRLMQYCARSGVRIPESKVELAHLMHAQVDSVLSYTALSNADAGNQNGLAEYLHAWFYDLLSWQIQTEEDPELAKLLRQEDVAWREYHGKAMKTYETVSDSSGSGFHYQLFRFGGNDMLLRRTGVETLYAAVFPDASIPFIAETESHTFVSGEQVKKGYQDLKNNLPDWGEGPFSTQAEMKSALNSERRSWDMWMKARARVSDKLSCERKSVWDRATDEIQWRKLEMLEHRYFD